MEKSAICKQYQAGEENGVDGELERFRTGHRTHGATFLQKEQNSSGKKLQLQGLKKKEEEEVDLWAQAICYMPEDPVLVLWLPKELGNLTVQYNIWADKKGKHCAKISKIKPSRKGVFEDEFLSETEGGDKAARIYVTFDQHGYEL